MSKGTVFLVGAGPGAPDLITVRGLECIRCADVLVYDRLVSSALVHQAPPHSKRIFAGKSGSHHAVEQDVINQLLLKHAQKGKRVVRLKGGDPFIFGRGGEEALFLAAHGIPVEIVPGLSSALAVPTATSIPLTHRAYASSVAVLTGHRRSDGVVPVVRADTVVYLMPVANLEKIVQKIIGSGTFPPETPCAMIEKGTYGGERVIADRLDRIAKRARKEAIRPPAILVIGEVVTLRDSITKPVGKAQQKVIEFRRFSKKRELAPFQGGYGKRAGRPTQKRRSSKSWSGQRGERGGCQSETNRFRGDLI
jgi:uroporphyrin-III C-methyltransferase